MLRKKQVKQGSTVSEISKKLGSQLERSDESIRDRIKRYLSKLNNSDEAKLAEAAKKTPNHHIHFVNDKQGHPFKTIGKISSEDPLVNLRASAAKKPTVTQIKASPKKVSSFQNS